MIKVMNDYNFDINIIGFNAINGVFRYEGVKASFKGGVKIRLLYRLNKVFLTLLDLHMTCI